MAEKTDIITPLVIVGGAVAVAVGASMILKKPAVEGFSNLKILGYTNRRTGLTATYPKVLEVEKDDFIDVKYSFDYMGSEVSRQIRAGLWKGDHIIYGEKEWPLDMPETRSKKTFELTVEIQVTSGKPLLSMAPDLYGIHLDLRGVTSIMEFWGTEKPVRLGVGGGITIKPLVISPGKTVPPGTSLTITVPIESGITTDRPVNVHISVAEGSILPSPGTELASYDKAVTLKAKSTTNVIFNDKATVPLGRRDITVTVTYQGEVIAKNSFDDAYYVSEATLTFSLLQPTASPQPVRIGETVKITCPIKYVSGIAGAQLTIHVSINEASILPMPGDFLADAMIDLTMSPGQTQNAVATWLASGEVGKKDVTVEVMFNGNVVAGKSFDDALSVQEASGLPPSPPPGVKQTFNLWPPVVSPASQQLGNDVSITCPLTCTGGIQNALVRVVITIAESSWLPSPAQELARSEVMLTISPGETKYAITTWKAAGAAGNKDISVDVYYQDLIAASKHFDDAFSVTQQPPPPPPPPGPTVTVTLMQPSASPSPGILGENVRISCPIYLSSGLANTQLRVEVIIAEASWLPMPGTELARATVLLNISPGVTKNILVDWYALGEVGKKDVAVEVSYGGVIIASNDFDDAFSVIAGTQPPPAGETLTLTLNSDPFYGGWITISPNKTRYAYGEIIVCQAHRIWPWNFKYWDVDGEWMGDAEVINLMILNNYVLTAHFG